jgi:ParB family chromosome partitioning protein
MMSKEDELRRTHGSAIGASFGASYASGITPAGMSLADAQRLPARLQGVVKSKDAFLIPTGKIQRDDDQPREEFDEESLVRLAESLKAKGQLQPIRVRWDEERGAYVIVSGERRWRAAVRAGISTLSCVVHEGTLDQAELLALQLIENALREDLRPVEQARAFRKLMEAHGWSGNRLAQELAITQSTVSRALTLLDLPESVQAKVDAGEVSARTGYELSKLSDAEQACALAEQAAAGKLPLEQAAAVVRARTHGRPKAEPGGKTEFRYPDGGKIVVTLPPGAAGDAAYLDMLQRAVKDVRARLRTAAREAEGQGEAA